MRNTINQSSLHLRWLTLGIALVFLLSATTADAKRRKRKKRRRKAAATKVVKPEAPSAPAPEPTATDSATASESGSAEGSAAESASVAPSPEPAAEVPSVASEETPAADATSAADGETTELRAQSADDTTTPAESMPAVAAEGEQTASASELPSFSAGVQFGGFVPGVFSRLDATAGFAVEVGYLLPFLGNRVAVVGGMGYLWPVGSASGDDSRLASSSTYQFTINDDELTFAFGAMARLMPPDSFFNGYLRWVGELHLQRTVVTATAGGEALGVNQETATAGGMTVGLGGELLLGPGALNLELGFSWAALEHDITGATQTGGLAMMVGYRFLL